MSFRGRLRVFFTLIVLVPLIVVAAVALALTASSEHGKADAGLAAALDTAAGLHREAVAAARPALRRVGADPRLQQALVDDDRAAARRRMRQLVAAPGGPARIALLRPDGDDPGASGTRGEDRPLAAAGDPDAIAPQVATIDGSGGGADRLAVSVTLARAYARRVERLVDLGTAVYRDGRLLATTDTDAPTQPPPTSARTLTGHGADYRVRVGRLAEPVGPPLEVLLIKPAGGMETTIANNRLAILALVGVFLVAAIAAASLVGRGLTGQINRFVNAAQRLGRGDFSHPVPVRGRDEFAALGREFNSMSDDLESNIAEVERQRGDLEEMIRRVGDALATGLERQGVVELTVRTAVNACEAQAARAVPIDHRTFEQFDVGDGLGPALEGAERLAFRPGRHTGRDLMPDEDEEPPRRRRAATIDVSGTVAAAVAMRSVVGSAAEYVGVLSIARRGAPFTREQLELLEYLAGQAVVSIENASLHEAIERQAVTDELTGLANKRAFHSIFDRELERAKRFDAPLGLVMVDIDKFKSVNDTYGHQMGDHVLAAVAGVVRELSRDVDAPARYGGEEMAVILPGTDAEGALQLAERMREAIEALRVPKIGESGHLQVTASFGAGSVPESAADKDGLIAAADAALYRAKHNGRNRVEAAEPVVAPG